MYCDPAAVHGPLAQVGTPGGLSVGDEAWDTFLERRAEIERIEFQRSELNFRTNSRIRATLSETQLARIGGLPDPDTERGDEDSFR